MIKKTGEGTDITFRLGFDEWVEKYILGQGTNSMSKKFQKYKITNAYYTFKNFLLLQITNILKENAMGSLITRIVKASKKTNVYCIISLLSPLLSL